jgi:CubicO group peptidase (beta-lactamase class C family)
MDLQARLDEALGPRRLAGVAAGIVHGDEVVAMAAAGDAGGGRPVTTSTPFLLASITKTFTAIAVMQQVEQGRLDLDAPVDRALRSVALRPRDPSFPPVTARHLLTHTAGIGELRTWRDLFRPTIGLGGAPDPDYYAGGLTVEVAPGSKWSYANHGFGVLGRLVEDLTGEAFPHYVRDHLFEPLGMKDTGFGGPRAGGFAHRRGRMRAVPTIEVATPAAGGIVSTVEDMTAYLRALLGGGEPILRLGTLHAMLEPQYRPDPRLDGMGLAFMLERLGGHRVAGHDGGWGGCSTTLAFAPDGGWGVVVLTNTSSIGQQHGLALDLLAGVLDVPPEATALPHPGVTQPTALFAELAGSYRPEPGWNTNFRVLPLLEVEVVDRGDHLQVKPLTPLGGIARDLRLHPVDPSEPRRFDIDLDGVRIPVVFTEDGRLVADFPVPAMRRREGLDSRKAQLRLAAAAGAVVSLLKVSSAARRRPRSGRTA